ncbi:hypothetical protein AeNC1_010836 [Aphanomyces euteiches]|nr:hypothetical protein AeNC1_010836 [Aphanomyces euteiches]
MISPWAPEKPGSTSPIVYNPVMGPAHDPTESIIYSPPLLSPVNAPFGHPPSPSRLNLTPLDIHAANGDDHEGHEEHDGSIHQAHDDEKEQCHQGGVIAECTDAQPDHAVIAVGYDGESYNVRNSWESSWGCRWLHPFGALAIHAEHSLEN